MLNTILKQSIIGAVNEAVKNNHEIICLEHFLLGLLSNQKIAETLINSGFNFEAAKNELSARMSQFMSVSQHYYSSQNVCYSSQLRRVLQKILQHQERSSHSENSSWLEIFYVVLDECNSHAVEILKKSDLNLSKIKGLLRSGNISQHEKEIPIRIKHTSIAKTTVPEYVKNLLENATKMDALVGRGSELDQTIKVLCQMKRNNPLLVGEVGVGKQAIVKELARRIAINEIPKKLSGLKVYSIDLGFLFMNLRHRGELEARFKFILDEILKENKLIVFIGDFYNFISGKELSEFSTEKNNILEFLLSSEKIYCIGSTTYEQYRTMTTKNPNFLRYYSKIDVQEPRDDETFSILKNIKLKYESYHQVEYSDDALHRTIELSRRYIPETHLPEKAIEILDEAGAYRALNSQDLTTSVITPHDIDKVVSKKVNIPLESLSVTERELFRSLPERLKSVVYGQNEAIDLLCNAIQLSKFGLKDPRKPIGSFLLAGPTGVGKTEISKQLAKMLNIEFIRFDMSEYMEKHAVAKLIGAPPGYIGYEQGGLLTEAINKDPHCVLLLDEIEKAHPEIFNLLLQVMDYGCLTDSNGRKADFNHVMLIMTTNAGAQQLEKTRIGFSIDDSEENSTAGEINQLFSPEFRNRLDDIIHFNYLDKNSIMHIANKQLSELKKFLTEKNILLNLTEAAENWIVHQGYNRTMGARPLEHLIKNKIKIPLSVEILYGKLADRQGTVNIDVEDDDLTMQFDLNVQ
ncbi:MAG: hypothetical protein A3F10_00430 [Coxiella sp. RIFCSPHIGHO2_12_FULL_42_15]|nr:MAG: hypothetical protein A3F10_00430 [Coxiella sp. RIFCSPHIGHO2_12_FULL_42_15]